MHPLLPTLCPCSLLPLDLTSQRVTSEEAGEEVDRGGRPVSLPVLSRPPLPRLPTLKARGQLGEGKTTARSGGNARQEGVAWDERGGDAAAFSRDRPTCYVERERGPPCMLHIPPILYIRRVVSA